MQVEKIKRLRLKLGISMEEAAKAAGIGGKGNWWRIESGQDANVTVAKLEKIAAVLKTTAADLLTPDK